MRLLVLLGFGVIALVAVGVIHISKTNNEIEITIDRQKAEAAEEMIIDRGKQVLGEAQDALDKTSAHRLQTEPADGEETAAAPDNRYRY